VEPVRAPGRRRASGVAAVLVLSWGLAGCSAAERPADPTPTARSTVVPSVPADGVTLQSLGYLNGPVAQFSLPRTTVVRAAVDQTNNVTAVLTSPRPTEVAEYLRRALPAAGFTVTADQADRDTLTFVGHGWSGSFTANGTTSAVLLRPA
jgi:hypothetical protein